ncbi:SDR family NAD(P)-dependent oxidoreductase [Flavobacterium sp. 20NA77.7]|uniref:SDR family NAD(P)-dependent oxidoreductase n=1 Tax=Flavobacterium nakdongensis TaxID=3073563 RepID=A0ABY9R937_9FLAO|nr:SDR family NAD(P)-dependent oxidoreductase [Flavobacterium sp. 20NA77.7]WMW77184.1 SDR family NAD(P)-dependent oxidoreductase [Flavobacterium sp. 20NA77.7]
MKKAIVIGATSGIGKALARVLAKENYSVGITGRRTHLLQELKNENPSAFFDYTIDNSDLTTVKEKLESLQQQLGEIDLIVLSAGVGFENPDFEFEKETQTIQTNVLGFTAVAEWAYSLFTKQKKGHLVVISSIAGLRGNPDATSYFASKAYQINFTEGLQKKAILSKLPITITDCRPGFVATKMALGDGIFWMASPERAAHQIYTAIKSKRKVAYITKRWYLIALLLKCAPKFLYAKYN